MFIPLHDANQLRHIRLQYVTLGVIIVNCLIWLFFVTAAMSDPDVSKAAFFSYGFVPAVANGYETLPPQWAVIPEPLTYVSYAFFHGDFMHLAGNMLFIWVFGDNVEDAVGHFRFVLFFLACAAAGALAHSLAQPESISPLIGASGAAAGVITAYLMLHPHVKVWILALGRIPLRIPALWVIGAWILFQVGNFVANPDSDVSWAAHIGGIVAGAVLIPVMKRRGVALFDRRPVAETIPPTPSPALTGDDLALPDEAATSVEPAERRRHMPWGRQPPGS